MFFTDNLLLKNPRCNQVHFTRNFFSFFVLFSGFLLVFMMLAIYIYFIHCGHYNDDLFKTKPSSFQHFLPVSTQFYWHGQSRSRVHKRRQFIRWSRRLVVSYLRRYRCSHEKPHYTGHHVTQRV